VVGIVVWAEPDGHGAWRGLVEICRALHGKGLVGADFIELLAEVIELELLGLQAEGGGDSSVPFEGEMHAFVDGVLLGAAGFDELGVDAELDEPDGEGGEASQCTGGEGDAVVGANAMGEAVLEEEPGEVLLGLMQGDFGVGVDAEDEAGSQVGDGERETVGGIAEAELALVIGRPDVVGSMGRGLGAARMGAAIAAPGPNEAMLGEDPGSGGHAGKMALGVALA